jgi:flagellar hook-basal body complex protein FliE
MTNAINGLGQTPFAIPPAGPGRTDATSSAGTASFQDLLLNSIAETNEHQLNEQSAVEESLSGGDITQVEVATEMKKADLSLRMMLQIRNKLLEAYNEIKDMRI